MITAEVVLLIIGIISISVSFFVGNRQKSMYDPAAREPQDGSRDIWTQKEEDMVREQIDKTLKQEKEAVVAETTQQLNQKSNEKIMEFDEFSSQLMEKINRNHEEVVFMYNMLGEKEKELKDLMGKKPDHTKQETGTSAEASGMPASKQEKGDSSKPAGKTAAEGKTNRKVRRAEPGSTSEKIVQMYKQGKSILDISRELGIGQGEVKLMIALYGGSR